MATYAVINSPNNVCDNVIVWDDTLGPWEPPADHYIVNIVGLDVGIGYHYDPNTKVWTPPPSVDTAVFAPLQIFLGQSATLSWTTTDATSVTLSKVAGQEFPANGSYDFTPTTSGKFGVVVTAVGLAGTAQATANVTVYSTQAELTAASNLV